MAVQDRVEGGRVTGLRGGQRGQDLTRALAAVKGQDMRMTQPWVTHLGGPGAV